MVVLGEENLSDLSSLSKFPGPREKPEKPRKLSSWAGQAQRRKKNRLDRGEKALNHHQGSHKHDDGTHPLEGEETCKSRALKKAQKGALRGGTTFGGEKNHTPRKASKPGGGEKEGSSEEVQEKVPADSGGGQRPWASFGGERNYNWNQGKLVVLVSKTNPKAGGREQQGEGTVARGGSSEEARKERKRKHLPRKGNSPRKCHSIVEIKSIRNIRGGQRTKGWIILVSLKPGKRANEKSTLSN